VDVLHGRRPRLIVGVVVLRPEWFEPELLRRESERDDESGRDKRPLHHTHIFVDPAARYQEPDLGRDGAPPSAAPVFRNVPRRSRSKIEGVLLPVTLPLIDHLALRVRDERRSRTFYEQALEPFGVKVVESSRGPGFAIEGGGDFWIEEGEPPAAPVHVAFAAADRATVDKFHRAAVEAGGRDNGAPGLRPHYHAGYYAAFVIDPDGNNVEAVFHGDRQLPAT
jgi:catechol 2,3-dioxygenase-like lactoylglutathione lyase family enzyme